MTHLASVSLLCVGKGRMVTRAQHRGRGRRCPLCPGHRAVLTWSFSVTAWSGSKAYASHSHSWDSVPRFLLLCSEASVHSFGQQMSPEHVSVEAKLRKAKCWAVSLSGLLSWNNLKILLALGLGGFCPLLSLSSGLLFPLLTLSSLTMENGFCKNLFTLCLGVFLQRFLSLCLKFETRVAWGTWRGAEEKLAMPAITHHNLHAHPELIGW